MASQKIMGIWIKWLFKKTNSIAGEVERGTPRRMWSYLKEKPDQGPWSEELWWSNQSCRQREGTSFKACFIESHKKWSGWIVPLGNQLEDSDINLSLPLEVNKHMWLSQCKYSHFIIECVFFYFQCCGKQACINGSALFILPACLH